MLFDPFCYLREMFVLLPDVVFLTEIDEVDDRFRSEEE